MLKALEVHHFARSILLLIQGLVKAGYLPNQRWCDLFQNLDLFL